MKRLVVVAVVLFALTEIATALGVWWPRISTITKTSGRRREQSDRDSMFPTRLLIDPAFPRIGRWARAGRDSTIPIYLDTATALVEPDGNIAVWMWQANERVAHLGLTIQGRPTQGHNLLRMIIDCRQLRVQSESFVSYAPGSAGDSLAESIDVKGRDTTPTPIVPGSISEVVQRAVCR